MEKGSGNRLQHTREDIYYYPQLASAQECSVSKSGKAGRQDDTSEADFIRPTALIHTGHEALALPP